MAHDYVSLYRDLLRQAPAIGCEESTLAPNVAPAGTIPYAA
jgi:hypothetical protein